MRRLRDSLKAEKRRDQEILEWDNYGKIERKVIEVHDVSRCWLFSTCVCLSPGLHPHSMFWIIIKLF